jgi:comEA protein
MIQKIRTGFMSGGLALLLILSFLAVQTAAQTPSKKININTATSAELQKLPRVGPKIAQRIIDFRKENGLFNQIEDLMKVKGIGEKTFLRLKDMITVEEARTQKK